VNITNQSHPKKKIIYVGLTDVWYFVCVCFKKMSDEGKAEKKRKSEDATVSKAEIESVQQWVVTISYGPDGMGRVTLYRVVGPFESEYAAQEWIKISRPKGGPNHTFKARTLTPPGQVKGWDF